MQLGAADEFFAIRIVVERLHPGRIARADERSGLRIPDDDREVADQLDGKLFAPALVAAQHEFRVGVVAEFESRVNQLRPQVGAVVDSAVEDEAVTRRFVRPRLLLVDRFGRRVQHALAERDRALGPHSSAVRPSMVDRVEHRGDRTDFNRSPVAVEYRADSAQRGALERVQVTEKSFATRNPQHPLRSQFVHQLFEIGPETRRLHVIFGEQRIDYAVG